MCQSFDYRRRRYTDRTAHNRHWMNRANSHRRGSDCNRHFHCMCWQYRHFHHRMWRHWYSPCSLQWLQIHTDSFLHCNCRLCRRCGRCSLLFLAHIVDSRSVVASRNWSQWWGNPHPYRIHHQNNCCRVCEHSCRFLHHKYQTYNR